jgi:hypothetical protein
MDYPTLYVAIGGMLLTVIGWGYTYFKQKELAETQKEIQNKISEHNIKFEKLHLERTTIMVNIYEQLVEISKYAGERNFLEIEKLFNKLWEYYEKHDLFLDKNLSGRIKEMMNSLSELGMKGIAKGNAYKDGFIEVAEDFNIRVEEIIELEIPILKDEIKTEMQKILGVV